MADDIENAMNVASAPPPLLPASDLVNDSQTQPDTQRATVHGADVHVHCGNDLTAKRKTTSRDNMSRRPSKKIKISMGPAVDLGD